MQKLNTEKSRYENVPIYSLDELERLSKQEAKDAKALETQAKSLEERVRELETQVKVLVKHLWKE